MVPTQFHRRYDRKENLRWSNISLESSLVNEGNSPLRSAEKSAEKKRKNGIEVYRRKCFLQMAVITSSTNAERETRGWLIAGLNENPWSRSSSVGGNILEYISLKFNVCAIESLTLMNDDRYRESNTLLMIEESGNPIPARYKPFKSRLNLNFRDLSRKLLFWISFFP